MYLETVTALAAAMEAKDQYTASHADSLAAMAVAVGSRMGLTDARAAHAPVRRGAARHRQDRDPRQHPQQARRR